MAVPRCINLRGLVAAETSVFVNGVIIISVCPEMC